MLTCSRVQETPTGACHHPYKSRSAHCPRQQASLWVPINENQHVNVGTPALWAAHSVCEHAMFMTSLCQHSVNINIVWKGEQFGTYGRWTPGELRWRWREHLGATWQEGSRSRFLRKEGRLWRQVNMWLRIWYKSKYGFNREHALNCDPQTQRNIVNPRQKPV